MGLGTARVLKVSHLRPDLAVRPVCGWTELGGRRAEDALEPREDSCGQHPGPCALGLAGGRVSDRLEIL